MGGVYMSEREVDIYEALMDFGKGHKTLVSISKMLNISCFQLLRKRRALKEKGKEGLISKARGKRSNNVFSKEKEELILQLNPEVFRETSLKNSAKS